MQVLDHGYLKLAEPEDENVWGSDENIIRAARMSTDKGFKGWGVCDGCVRYLNIPFIEQGSTRSCDCAYNPPGDEKLLRYLWTNRHMTPFEMAGMVVEVQCPLFVAREWMRHRTQSYNELSGRYTELPDLCYIPSVERLMAGRQHSKNKQGSEGGFSEHEATGIYMDIETATREARDNYEQLLARGVARELARLVVPVNQYTRFRAMANLRNWLQFLDLRLPEAVQWEFRQYSNALAVLVKEHFPRTWQLFEEGR